MPINLIVVIAIAVLVLIVLAAFFSGAFGSSVGSMDRQAALNTACAKLRTIYNCATSNLHTITVMHREPGDAVERAYPLSELCTLVDRNPQGTPNECAIGCGCPGTMPTG